MDETNIKVCSRKVIHARGLLQCIAYDMKQMLDDGKNTHTIYSVITKRLHRINRNNDKYLRVDWS